MRARLLARLGPALGERDFRLWWLAMIGMYTSLQMLEVAIGWQVYAQHGSPLDLGWIGLAEFIPMFVLVIPAGQLADRLPRKLVFAAALVVGAAVGAALAVLSATGSTALAPYLALAAGAGCVMAVGTPAARAMPPALVPGSLLPSAMTLRTIAAQAAQVVGPAIGGVLFGVSPELPYLITAGACLAAAVCAVMITSAPVPGSRVADAAAGRPSDPPGLESVLAGLKFTGRTPMLLGAILLDLVVVLFGGAVALLPVFAQSILHTGPDGLGLLRAAPAVGALAAAAVITRRPLTGRAGRLLLVVVAVYGASTAVFGLSRIFALSLVMLAISGFADMFSMNIRSTIVALATPDHLRGRVSAVEALFISASNQLGAFESGLAASLVGTVPAAAGGGMLTIVLALCWGRLFPAMRRIDKLHEIRPAGEVQAAPEPASL